MEKDKLCTSPVAYPTVKQKEFNQDGTMFTHDDQQN
jgi:hypothetical protein